MIIRFFILFASLFVFSCTSEPELTEKELEKIRKNDKNEIEKKNIKWAEDAKNAKAEYKKKSKKTHFIIKV